MTFQLLRLLNGNGYETIMQDDVSSGVHEDNQDKVGAAVRFDKENWSRVWLMSA
jgi:hypothetical protein